MCGGPGHDDSDIDRMANVCLVAWFLVSFHLANVSAFFMPSVSVRLDACLFFRLNPSKSCIQRDRGRLAIPPNFHDPRDIRGGRLAIFSSSDSINEDSSKAVELATVHVKKALRDCILESKGGQDLLAESLATLTVRYSMQQTSAMQTLTHILLNSSHTGRISATAAPRRIHSS